MIFLEKLELILFKINRLEGELIFIGGFKLHKFSKKTNCWVQKAFENVRLIIINYSSTRVNSMSSSSIDHLISSMDLTVNKFASNFSEHFDQESTIFRLT